MRALWLVALGLILAACTEPDPLTEARRTCLDGGVESEARIEACSSLIDSGELPVDERADVFASRGAAQAEAGDVTAALRDYGAALELDADTMLAVKGRADILIASGQLDAAEPLVQRLIDSGEFAAEAHYLDGSIARQRGDDGAALAAFDRSIAADERFFPAYVDRGAVKQELRDYAGALADYDSALRINGQVSPALAGRCWTRVLMDDGDLSRARDDGDEAAEIDPRNVQAQLCRGILQLRAEEWDAARASYEAALEVEPGNPNALFGRGVARRRGGDNDGREDMNQARDFEPHIARAFEELGVRTY